MTGKLNSEISSEISMKKAKALSKSMGITFNDLILGMVSKVFKQHFDDNNDKSKFISVQSPLTFV